MTGWGSMPPLSAVPGQSWTLGHGVTAALLVLAQSIQVRVLVPQRPRSSADRAPVSGAGCRRFDPCRGHASIAQLVEQPAFNRRVRGSKPRGGTRS